MVNFQKIILKIFFNIYIFRNINENLGLNDDNKF